MIEDLQNGCDDLVQVLNRVEARCRGVLACVEMFDGYVGSYLTNRLLRRLAILAIWIKSGTDLLYRDHGGQGYVRVFLAESDGVIVDWVEMAELMADKSWYRSWGYTVLSVVDFLGILGVLVDELAAGNWEKVVRWLNTYGRSPGLDFDRFP